MGISVALIGDLIVVIRQKSDSNTHTSKEQGLDDSPPGEAADSPDIYEEISEDAYKRNSVYRSWATISPEQDRAASKQKYP